MSIEGEIVKQWQKFDVRGIASSLDSIECQLPRRLLGILGRWLQRIRRELAFRALLAEKVALSASNQIRVDLKTSFGKQ